MKIFLDSGAFSVWNKGKQIDLNDYISLCRHYLKYLDVIASLDVIPGQPYKKITRKQIEEAAKQGFKNYYYMLSKGIPQEKLVHTFHQGDPEEYLEKLVQEGGPYIGISPANDKTSAQRRMWLDNTCSPHIIDKDGKTKIKFHGFAVTSLKLAFHYPWHSVDSSSWQLRGGGYGLIDVPSKFPLKNQSDYHITSIPISKGIHTFTKHKTKKGFDLGEEKEVGQLDAYFAKKRSYRSCIENLLHEYGFSLDELTDSSELRAAWNAMYLMNSIRKFNKQTTLYLATNNIKGVEILRERMHKANMDYKKINILVSFAMLPKKKGKSVLDTLINMKKEDEED